MERWGVWLVVVVVVVAGVASARQCHSYKDCTSCIRTPTCMWCRKVTNTTSNYANCFDSEADAAEFNSWMDWCDDQVTDPRESTIKVNAGDKTQDFMPQEVNLELRVDKAKNITLTYLHHANYPVDLYYLMDASTSMTDDKDNLVPLTESILQTLSNITSDLHIGYGTFVDKPMLPYKDVMELNYNDQIGVELSTLYSFKNALHLTGNTAMFQDAVIHTEFSRNKDGPEGMMDALMQVMVCQEEVQWRDQSVRVVFVATDAAFHYAGDAKIAGIIKPNDMQCHLDGSYYSKASVQDYPSVSQINKMATKHDIIPIFAATESHRRLYEALTRSIKAAKYGVLSDDSKNVLDLIRTTIQEIISRVELQVKQQTDNVQVTMYSDCGDATKGITQTNKCEQLEDGKEVTFHLEFKVTGCPNDDWTQSIDVAPIGRKSKFRVNLAPICKCKCDTPGDPGYIPNSEVCNEQGTLACSVCICDDGYIGDKCQCESKGAGGGVGVEGCLNANNVTCSGRGTCECGECTCAKRTNPLEIVSGKYCECTNFENCQGEEGGLCSGHGRCECSSCKCDQGWTGDFCNCQNSNDNCLDEDGEVCSGHGSCACNKCECRDPYYGRICEDCPTCTGKCDEHKACVQCLAYGTGELSAPECLTCNAYNVTKVDDVKVEGEGEKLCTFFDDEDCVFSFVYVKVGDGVAARAQREPECPKPFNFIILIISLIGAVVLIGILTLIIWKIYATIQDRREFQRFILAQNEEKWHNEINPLYKEANTKFQNPMYEQSK